MVVWHHWLNGHELEQTGRWWRTRKPGVLQFMGSQRVRHSLVTEQQHTSLHCVLWAKGAVLCAVALDCWEFFHSSHHGLSRLSQAAISPTKAPTPPQRSQPMLWWKKLKECEWQLGTLPLHLNKQFDLPQLNSGNISQLALWGALCYWKTCQPTGSVWWLHNCSADSRCGWTITWKGTYFSAWERRKVHARLSRAILLSRNTVSTKKKKAQPKLCFTWQTFWGFKPRRQPLR